MARRAASPFRIYRKDGYAWIDTTIAGQRVRRSLGVAYSEPPSRAQRVAAQKAAEERYAEWVSGRTVSKSSRVLTSLRFEESYGMWLDEIETPNNADSIKTRRGYGRNILRWSDTRRDSLTPFERIVADGGPQAFVYWSLSRALRKTVKKERSNLFMWMRWAKNNGHIAALPPYPELPLSEPGVRTGKQRAQAVHISPAEALQIVLALPEWSKGRPLNGERVKQFRVRAPNEFSWEMAMRPITVARLRVPENWRPGSSELVLHDADDKARYGRTLKLTARARAILEECTPRNGGVIFGEHDYREHLKAAALKVLPLDKAKKFAAYDFRHGRAKALLKASGSLMGTAFVLGHKQLTTTNVYLAGDGKDSGDDAIDAVDGLAGTIPTRDTDVESDFPSRGEWIRTTDPQTPSVAADVDSAGNEAQGATEFVGNADEEPPAPSNPARFRHGPLTDAARGLAIEMAVWDAFDAFERGAR